MSKNRKKRTIVKIMLAVIFISLVAWTVWGNLTVGVSCYTVASNKLPASFDHYKIAVVSDLHNAEFGEKNSRLVQLTKDMAPDMIAITGDLVDSGKPDANVALTLIQSLMEIAPCYYVTGNHEAMIGAEYGKLEKALTDAGAVILRDRAVKLTKNGEFIQLAGLDDPSFTDRNSSVQAHMLETKLRQMDLTEDYCLLLSHRPETFGSYVSAGIDLVLSGHAHGGQFRLPFLGGIIAPNQGFLPKYDAGVYTQGYLNCLTIGVIIF